MSPSMTEILVNNKKKMAPQKKKSCNLYPTLVYPNNIDFFSFFHSFVDRVIKVSNVCEMMSAMKIKMSKFYTVKKVTCLAVLRIALSSRCIEFVDDVSQVLPSIISPTFSGFAREKPVDGNNFA